ncbi:MAG: cell division protein ZapE [Steroidobacterales bacterium]
MSPSTVAARYDELVARQQIASDSAQRLAIERLDALREELVVHPRRYGFWRRRLMQRFPHRAALTPPRGVYLWGGVGRGKTLIMDLFFDALPITERRRTHFHRFMHDLHAELGRLHHRSSPLDVVAHRIARRTRVLCFDEFFVTDIADAMLLGTLLEGLFRRGVALVATSNVAPADLYRDGLQRQRFLPAIALIEQSVEVVHVDHGVDYRLRELERAAIFQLASSPEAHARMQQAFEKLAVAEGSAGGELTIAGRPIAYRRLDDGIVWFDFAAICGGPRSQDDYIEIAHEYHTVLVSAVPQFGATTDDAARRFIALVDEFYDRAVNLILSAAVPIVDLYRGTRLKFEFQRTVSRLIEMQSREYLARPHRP